MGDFRNKIFAVIDRETTLRASHTKPLIQTHSLEYAYPNGVKALDGIDIEIFQGEMVAIVGQNGSGKTTLAKHFNGLLMPTAGEVIVDGIPTQKQGVFKLGQKVGYVFQNPDHQIFSETVFEEVAFSPRLRNLNEGEVKERVREALEAVGLSGYEEEDPFSLSKSGRQRVAVASILAAKPEVLILDEPTTGLDYAEQRSMMEMVRQLNDNGSTIIFVTHHMWVVAEYAHRVFVMKNGKVFLEGPTREVFAHQEELRSAALRPPQYVEISNLIGKRCKLPKNVCLFKEDEILMNAEIYLDRDTFMHRLDPRTKIIIFLLTFVVALLFNDPFWMLPIIFLVMLELVISGSIINMRRIWYLIVVLTVTGLVMWNVFSRGKTPLFWFLTVESLEFSIARTMIMIVMISAGMILLSTTRNEELILGLIRLGLPYRVGFAISTSLRLVPMIAASMQTISQAQRSRGLDLDGGNPIERIRKYVPLLIPVFISTIRNTNIFGMALESKGFGARGKRTFYLKLEMKMTDYIALVFLILFTATSVYLYVLGYGQLAGLTQF